MKDRIVAEAMKLGRLVNGGNTTLLFSGFVSVAVSLSLFSFLEAKGVVFGIDLMRNSLAVLCILKMIYVALYFLPFISLD